MKNLEEKLWDYIDGNLSKEESERIQNELKSNAELKKLYSELLIVNQSFNKIDLDEPSMSFTRKVMDIVGQEKVYLPLKTKVNKYIIFGAFGLCLCCMLLILIYAFQMNSTATKDFDYKFDVNIISNPIFLYTILFIYSVMILVLVDLWIRNKLKSTNA